MAASFTQKILQVDITLLKGTFNGTDNTVTLRGLRTHCQITKGGEPSKNSCKMKVYGMLMADMQKLTTIPGKSETPLVVHNSIMRVQAGDLNGMNLAFQGNITSAFASYKSPPNLVFEMEAMSGYYPAIQPSKPKGYKGPTPVVGIFQGLASEMGVGFENNGVTATVQNPYLEGSPYDQAASLADMCNLEFGIDDGTMFIAPRGNSRTGNAVLISPQTGLKEYPVFDKEGLHFDCLYNPALKLGGLVSVQSSIQLATGTWRIHGLVHNLEAENPGGKWLSTVKCTRIGAS